MRNIKDTNHSQLKLYTASLLLKVASADNILRDEEIQTISEILCNFYKLNKKTASDLMIEAKRVNDDSIDLYEAGSFVNESLCLQDKIDFIGCIYQVAYADNNMHFLERHIINQILNILNINREQLKKIKDELRKNLL